MRLAARIVTADRRRATRFHSERGQIMPLDAWYRLPSTLWQRLSGRHRNQPWIVPSALSFLAKTITRDWKVFEFGSGYSTVWYAERCQTIVSLESDAGWYQRVGALLRQRAIANCSLRMVEPGSFLEAIAAFPDATFDLVMVDGDEPQQGHRVLCVAAAAPKVRPGGFLALDDSDRAAYGDADGVLEGWRARRFVGVKPFPLTATETSIYERPSGESHDREQ
jgi:hypothetical protein